MEIFVCLVFKEKSEACILVFKWKHNMSLSIFFEGGTNHKFISCELSWKALKVLAGW
jgi:hypothetical protein